jgi:hypothetical protein
MRSALLQEHGFRLGVGAIKLFPLTAARGVNHLAKQKKRPIEMAQTSAPNDPSRLI